MYTLALLTALVPSLIAQPARDEVIVIKAASVVTVSGEAIPRGEIVIVNGKIELVGRQLEYPAHARVIDAPASTIFPGLIDAHTRAGLPGYQRTGVRADLDVSREIVWPEIDLSDHLRAGFTTIAIHPAGDNIPGVASAYHTAGDGDRLLSRGAYLRVSFDSMPGDKDALRGAFKRAQGEIEKVDKARKEWEAKQEEARKKAEAEKAQQPPAPTPAPTPTPSPTPPPAPPTPTPPTPSPQSGPPPAPAAFEPHKIDPAVAPLVDLLQKKPAPTPMLELFRGSDTIHALDVMDQHKDVPFTFQLIANANDFVYTVPTLGERKAKVLLSPSITRLPNTVVRYNLAGELAKAGCIVSFAPASDSEPDLAAHRARAADAVKFGMGRQEALRALTIEPARLLGLDSRLGTIEKGKDADLIFLTGDPLDPAARVTRVMILGQTVWEEPKP